jgi:tetraacyldisaccharide 4'-kinase
VTQPGLPETNSSLIQVTVKVQAIRGTVLNKLDFLFTLGRPFSPFYSGLMSLRAFLYKKNLFKTHSLPVPVISIGNLTMGGSGKTPVIRWLATFLRENGYRPAVISRGYGGNATERSNLVSDGNTILLDHDNAGDEPYMLARSLENTPVLTGKKRIHPCLRAINELETDIILLDDGFQHMAVQRVLDLVLFNATTLAGNSRVFPGGELREPVNSLKRCSGFMITGITEDNRTRADRFTELLSSRFPGKPVYQAHLKTGEIISAEDHTVISDTTGLDQVFAFCAIANPERFKQTIRREGISLVEFKSFRDHGKYSRKVMDRLCRQAISSGATSLLTTEKDYVKIAHMSLDLPLYILKIRLEPENDFKEFILSHLTTEIPPQSTV